LNSFHTSGFLFFMYELLNKLNLLTNRWLLFIYGNIYYSREILIFFLTNTLEFLFILCAHEFQEELVWRGV
jgi:hypothetical protein